MSNLKVKLGTGGENKDGTQKKVGTIQLLGVRSFPLSFYEDEWRTIAKVIPGILAFIEKNKDHPAMVEARANHKKEGKTSSDGTTQSL